MRRTRRGIAALAAATLLATALGALAQEPASPAAPEAPATAAPATDLTVTLDLANTTLHQAFDAIAAQTGLSLVNVAPESSESRAVTLRVKNMPVDQALGYLVAGTDLVAKRDGNVLVVSNARGGGASAAVAALPGGHVHHVHKIRIQRSARVEPGGSTDAEGELPDAELPDAGVSERTSMGSDLLIETGEIVSDATAVGGTLTVRGTVKGDAVAVGGSVKLEQGASVDGDAVSVGGSVTAPAGVHLGGDTVSIGGSVDVDPSVTIGGDRVQVGGRLGSLLVKLIGLGHQESFTMRAASALLHIVMLLAVGVVFVTFVPSRVANVRQFLTARPGYSALAGLGLLLGFLPLCVVLAVTLIGIPLIPVALLAAVLLYLIGLTAAATWLGERMPVLADRKTPINIVLLGLGAIAALSLVPFLGAAVVFLVATMAAGAALLSKFGQPIPPPGAAVPPALPPVAPPAADSGTSLST